MVAALLSLVAASPRCADTPSPQSDCSRDTDWEYQRVEYQGDVCSTVALEAAIATLVGPLTDLYLERLTVGSRHYEGNSRRGGSALAVVAERKDVPFESRIKTFLTCYSEQLPTWSCSIFNEEHVVYDGDSAVIARLGVSESDALRAIRSWKALMAKTKRESLKEETSATDNQSSIDEAIRDSLWKGLDDALSIKADLTRYIDKPVSGVWVDDDRFYFHFGLIGCDTAMTIATDCTEWVCILDPAFEFKDMSICD
jgi:hypothetical protein